MDYTIIYNKIINNRKLNPINSGYYEKHHIIPKSLGGKNTKDNLIKLTAREHFVCHILLVKMYEKYSCEWHKMVRAALMMGRHNSKNRYVNSRQYTKIKELYSVSQSIKQQGNNNHQFNTIWIHNIEKRINKKISRLEKIPEDWVKGRKIEFDENLKNINKTFYRNKVKFKSSKAKYNQLIADELNRKIQYYIEIYYFYEKYGFDYVKNTLDYKYSKQNLVKQFAKYIENFIPQNGKKRVK